MLEIRITLNLSISNSKQIIVIQIELKTESGHVLVCKKDEDNMRGTKLHVNQIEDSDQHVHIYWQSDQSP